MKHNKKSLPQIPNKRYFTIGEVGYLCLVKPHVLRYWEQEFPQLKPAKRRGNRRYYQREDVVMVRTIRGLLYDEGYTISGARIQLDNIIKKQRKSNRETLASAEQARSHTMNSAKQSKESIKSNHLNESIYSVKFTVGEDSSQVTTVANKNSQHNTKKIKQKQADHSVQQPANNIDHQTHQNTQHDAQAIHATDKKIKKYKLVLSEVINELQDILSEIKDTSTA